MRMSVQSYLSYLVRGYTGLTSIKNLFSTDKSTALASIRITIITVSPILIGMLLNEPMLGLFGFLGGLYAVLADVGGMYHKRALAMGLATLGTAFAAWLATLVGGVIWLAVPLMFFWAFGLSMLGIYGNIGTKVTFVIIGIFIIVMGQPDPGSLLMASERAVAFLIGGAWAMLLSLWFWPWYPYQPIRHAVSSYYRVLATFISRACNINSAMQHGSGVGTDWNATISRERVQVMKSYNVAHDIVVSKRSAQRKSSSLSQNFLLLTLNADRLFNTVIAFAEEIERAADAIREAQIEALWSETVQQVADLVLQLAVNIDEGSVVDKEVLRQSISHIRACEDMLRELLPGLVAQREAHMRVRNVIRLLGNVVEELLMAFSYAERIQMSKQKTPTTVEQQQRTPGAWLQDAWHVFKENIILLRENMTPHSMIFRYALRLGIAIACGVVLSQGLHIINGYWIPLTILFVMKPDFAGTKERAAQRLSGSVIGGILAALIASLVHNEALLIMLLVIFAFYTYMHLSGNYGVFVLFLTGLVVMLFAVSIPGDWVIALIRIENTLIGVAITVVFNFFFWPLWESERFPAQLARTIAANRVYFSRVLAAYLKGHEAQGHDEDDDAIRRAGRHAHVENANAAAAFRRLLNEPKTKRGDAERFYALVTYNQHLNDRITALSTHLHYLHDHYTLPLELCSFVQQTEEILIDTEEAVRSGQHINQAEKMEESLNKVQTLLHEFIDVQMRESAEKQSKALDQGTEEDFAFIGSQLNRLTHDVAGMCQV